MEAGILSLPRTLSVKRSDQPYLFSTPIATSNFGVLNLGDAPFDGVSVGKYAGNTGGTYLAINAASGYAGQFLSFQLAGTQRFVVSASGSVFTNNVYTSTGGTQVLFQMYNDNSTASSNAFQFANNAGTGKLTANSGVQQWMNIAPAINQSGTAGYTGLLVNATETATGSGVKLLADLQLATVSKFSVNNAGNIAFAGVIVPGVLDAPAFSTPLTLAVTAAEVHKIGSITGAITINASAGGTAGQRMTIILPNDSSGTGWVVTFGTNFKPSGTLTGTSAKSASISWISDGTSWYEVGRATGLTL